MAKERQPYLPEGLDEAAEKAANKAYPLPKVEPENLGEATQVAIYGSANVGFKEGFKVGAEWAFGQFEMLEMNGRKCGLVGNDLHIDVSDFEKHPFDIYIRKK